MRIERWDPSDGETLRGCFEVRRAVHAADDPLGPPKSARVLGGWLRGGWSGDPGEALGFELCPPAFHTVELGVADALGRAAR